MKKIILSLVALIAFAPATVFANEGMWFLMHIQRLNQRDMQKMGLQLTAEEIYSINNSSVKDAIVQFNGGCTAEMISKDGLVLTNHHCGYDKIAELSTPESNYLRDGFWAQNRKAELKPKSLFVRFFVRMDDVTKRILGVVNDKMTEAEREAAINQETAKIQKENDGGGKYTVSVRPFFQGNEYYYFVYQDYTDVRLVGTPTESIGKFGGDTDNWEWPRHTGDFALFRVYADANGNPAEYSENNVPLKPKHHLPISLKGVQENDFAMILGYPGRTNRWMPAEGIEQNVKFAYPAWVEGSKMSMDKMKVHMDKDDKVRLDYASKYASIANYWKNRQGMIDALSQFKTADSKRKVEKKFDKWANSKNNKAQYGTVIKDINAYYALTNEKAKHDNYLNTLLRGTSFGTLPARLGNQLVNYSKADANQKAQMKPRLAEMIEGTFETIYLPLEKDVLAGQLALYAEKAKGYALAPSIQTMVDSKTDFNSYASNVIDLSLFTSKERLLAFLELPNAELVSNDPLYKLSSDLIDHFNKKSDELKAAEDKYQSGFRKLVAGLQESKLSPILYPDANSTLRLTYGKVRALPADKRNDAKINNYTTLAGMVKKHKAGDPEFDLSQPLIDLYNKKDFGQYADKAGYMPVNFLTDNDITGGNSGSPVLNGKGELIGLAFDGNIEAMAGDVIFDDKLQRTINVDIRFVLFIIDKYAGAKHIIDELTIVK
ncbi:S46 family peptidase [Flavobacterium sp. UBA6135]|uniref:S46 family peptidase n=1 Tax=Flavobacterium sp. UBA6135 TaxID=1946553 RepID=UPI0025C19C0D|nr:S46 family peptidase [Flavobacterium sp. UBA6135]